MSELAGGVGGPCASSRVLGRWAYRYDGSLGRTSPEPLDLLDLPVGLGSLLPRIFGGMLGEIHPAAAAPTFGQWHPPQPRMRRALSSRTDMGRMTAAAWHPAPPRSPAQLPLSAVQHAAVGLISTDCGEGGFPIPNCDNIGHKGRSSAVTTDTPPPFSAITTPLSFCLAETPVPRFAHAIHFAASAIESVSPDSRSDSPFLASISVTSAISPRLSPGPQTFSPPLHPFRKRHKRLPCLPDYPQP